MSELTPASVTNILFWFFIIIPILVLPILGIISFVKHRKIKKRSIIIWFLLLFIYFGGKLCNAIFGVQVLYGVGTPKFY
jgi:thiol:disulfide interchange protein